MDFAYIPSPSRGVWHLGPLPIRAYALCVLAGVLVALWVANRRWVARGGRAGTIGDVAVWAVPFGLVGARLYHVVSQPNLYFGSGEDPWDAFAIWDGGLGIWGAVALGALGGYIACRRMGISFLAVADTVAPAIAIAQAIGRWGNYFNQELFGKPSTLPWALEISRSHRVDELSSQYWKYQTFQPTFLYESIWDLGVAGLVIWAQRRFQLGWGRAFALYVMAYTFGRGWIEYLRIDSANHILGVRLNVWTAGVVFILAAIFFVHQTRRHQGLQPISTPEETGTADAAVASPDSTDLPLTAAAEQHQDDQSGDSPDEDVGGVGADPEPTPDGLQRGGESPVGPA